MTKKAGWLDWKNEKGKFENMQKMTRTAAIGVMTVWAAMAWAAGYHGTVSDGSGEPLPGARVYWVGTNVGTVTDSVGRFGLHGVKGHNRLVATFVGLKPDTVTATTSEVNMVLGEENAVLGEVVVHGSLRGNYIKSRDLTKTENISFAGLTKLACCNVAESFENSASVTVGYSDAITGARQIKMLGLAGPYTQVLDESRPVMRGLGAPYAMTYTPGMWLKSIQVSKGVSSVSAGHDAIAGQINLEYRKPTDEEKFFGNVYFDDMLRPEVNLAAAIPLTADKRLSTTVLVHGSADTDWRNMSAMDRNHDGFRDQPNTRMANVANRWLYMTKGGAQLRWGWRAIADRRVGGSVDFDGSEEMRKNMADNWNLGAAYGSRIDNRALNAYVKLALPFGAGVYDDGTNAEKRSSVAVVLDYDHFGEKAYFGLNDYRGRENDVTANAMVNLHFDAHSSLMTGVQTRLAYYREKLQNATPWQAQMPLSVQNLDRNEREAGGYAEYTFDLPDKLTVVAGMRTDYNDLHRRWLVTPRAHVKWNVTARTALRGSVGVGYRTANVITDNIGILTTGRRIVAAGERAVNFDGLDRMEKSLTSGVSLTQAFKLGSDDGASVSVDFFNTHFYNSVVADQEWGADVINIYSTGKRAETNNVQIDLNWTPVKRLDVFATFRYTMSKMTLDRPDGSSVRVERPLMSKYKGLVNLSYATKFRMWVFDVTAQVNGPQRVPTLTGNLADAWHSPAYAMLFAQVTRKVGKADVYAGCENIGDYRQKTPVVDASTPFSTGFNSMNVWGPLMGRKFYAGVRINFY